MFLDSYVTSGLAVKVIKGGSPAFLWHSRVDTSNNSNLDGEWVSRFFIFCNVNDALLESLMTKHSVKMS